MSKQRTHILTRLAVTLLIIVVAAAPVAFLAAPVIQRRIRIGWIATGDVKRRMLGLQYVAAHAGTDKRVLAGAVGAMDASNDETFGLIVGALQAAEVWSRATIPDDAWLRWLALAARRPDAEASIGAAQRLSAMRDRADDDRVSEIIAALIEHTDPNVRYNALCTAAELATAADQPAPYHNLITSRFTDPAPVIARHAHLFAYLLSLPGADPPVRLDAAQATPDPALNEAQLLSLLTSPQAPLRDVGCILAVRDLPEERFETLINELLSDQDTCSRMSGAILAGINGTHAEALRKRLAELTDWPTATVTKLGLWMQGAMADTEVDPQVLFAREDLPRTTVILAMLHRHDPTAFDALLNPQGEAPDDLAVLLEAYGWWRVLNRYLPEGAPRWRPGTDTQTQQLQVDLLRDWYLVNRHK